MAVDTSNIEVGQEVYGSDGNKVGEVGDVHSDYILVAKGFLFTKDIYVPPSAVTRIDDDKVHLNVPKDQIEDLGWNEPSAEGTGHGATDTGRAATTRTATVRDRDFDTTEQREPTQRVERADTEVERIPRHEEELQARKTERETGEVRISKDVAEEEQTLEVPVTREEVHVRSDEVDRPAGDASGAFQEGTVEVPVREDEVQVRKEPRVAEELEVSKETRQDTERVSGTVRREDVHVDQAGDVDVEGYSESGTRGS